MKTTKSLKELREEIAAKQKLGHQVYEEAGADLDFTKVKAFGENLDTKAKVEKLQALNTELADLKADYEEIRAIAEARKGTEEEVKNFSPAPEIKGGKSLGSMIMDSKAAKQHGTSCMIDVDMKTLFQRSAGWDPEALRLPGYVEYPARALMVADYIPAYPTKQDTIKYMLETTFTNSAAEAAEGNAVGESALALTETSLPVEKVGTFIPVSEEQLEDVEAVEAYLNNRLAYMVKARLDSQILNGDGSTPNLKGTLDLDTIQTQALGTDPVPDAIYKAFDLVRHTGFSEPTVLFSNPTDWQAVRLLRTADGIYIFGSPLDPGKDQIWGIPVCKTTAVVENTMITGDYGIYSGLFIKRGLQIEMSSGYSDYFVKGKFAVKATMRCCMVHYRETAFCTITGV
ncbi:MAG: phage major capsid protein [Dehalococcoidales bacterium]|nr:phage major capsid protein [Dehalococcoidales bacterium]